MRPLRVLIVTGMWPSASQPDYGAFVQAIGRALDERAGIEVDVAAITDRRSGAVRTPAKYATLTIRALRRARRADVIWGHYLLPAGAVAAGVGRITDRPWVLTAHGGEIANLARPGVRAATRRALHGAAAVTAVSDWLAERLEPLVPAGREIEVVNMGVDLTRFRPADRGEARRALGIDREGPLIIAVGGLTERKNPVVLVRALRRLRCAGSPARLVLVGDGPLAGAVRAEAARAGVAEAVTLTGALEPDDVARWMAAADLLALVSRPEPFGVVVIEALATGRPVVVTSEGGTPEILAPDPAVGQVVDPADPDAVAAGISAVLAEPADPARCRALARRHDVVVRAGQMATILARACGRL